MSTPTLSFKDAKLLLDRESRRLAILLGNGINLAGNGETGVSWDAMMQRLVTQVADAAGTPELVLRRLRRLLKRGEDGLTPASLPEVFDIIDAQTNAESASATSIHKKWDLQGMIAEMLHGMRPNSNHETIVRWAVDFSVPILTTNYDHCLQDTIKCKQRRFGGGPPKSDYYPWDRYYAPREINDPAKKFAIWHIHGDQNMKRSIRAGLDQYMGMAQRLRKVKQQIAKESLQGPDFHSEHPPAYHEAPWLKIFFEKKLWIQGLGLRAAEVSLRWLLIERFRYWRRYRSKHEGPTGWYIHGPTKIIGHLDTQRRVFFENVGLRVVEINKESNSFKGLYHR